MLTTENIWRVELNNSGRRVYQCNCQKEEIIYSENDESESEDEIFFKKPTIFNFIDINKNYDNQNYDNLYYNQQQERNNEMIQQMN